MGKRKKAIISALPSLLLVIVLIIIISFKLTENHRKQTNIENAVHNAQSYLMGKYGFEADFIEVSGEKYRIGYSEGYEAVQLKMNYNNRDFYVLAPMTQDNENCCDDYQWEEISKAVESYLCGNLPVEKICYIRLRDNNDCLTYYMMGKTTYFDGTNIEELLKNARGCIQLFFCDTSFSDNEFIEKLSGYDIDLYFTSFDTKEHMEEFLSLNTERTPLYNYGNYQAFAPYITDYYMKDSNGTERLDITFLETPEFKYAYFPVEYYGYNKTCNDIKAENASEKSELKPFFERCKESSWISKPLSEEYSFNSKFGDVWIYYPLDKLQGYNIEKIGLAWCSFGGMSNNRDIEKAVICGDYAVFHLPYGENYFMLVDNIGQEEYVPGWKKE